LGHIGKWAGKLVGTGARIAGLLHLATHLHEGYGKPIEAATVEAAIDIGDYFADHALTVFGLMGADAAQARARSLLEVLAANGWETVSRRDLFAKLSRSEFPTITDLEPAMALLEEHGYLRTHTRPGNGKRGRPPAPRYLVHPQVRENHA
jgi:replicative DNA helicase